MELTKLFFDMDGVLADFDWGVKELCGLTPAPQGQMPKEFKARLYTEMNRAGHFYGKLPPLPGAIEFFNEMHSVLGDKIAILSGVPRPEKGISDATEDKREWLDRYLPGDYEINIVLRSEKPLFCKGKGCVLIDDYDKNIREWEAAGGTGILHTDFESTRRKLTELGIL